MTVDELAHLLRKSASTVYRMAQKRQIPSLLIGGSRMFDPAALGMHFRKKSPASAAAALESRSFMGDVGQSPVGYPRSPTFPVISGSEHNFDAIR